jgi:hypothetical protein
VVYGRDCEVKEAVGTYDYRLADAGLHPNPGKAAEGRRLHRLEPDPVTAPVVERIFNEYVGAEA